MKRCMTGKGEIDDLRRMMDLTYDLYHTDKEVFKKKLEGKDTVFKEVYQEMKELKEEFKA